MTNAFDSTEYPTSEPTVAICGDRVLWKREDLGVDYDPTLYTLRYAGRQLGNGDAEIAFDATGDGTDFLVEIASAATTLWRVGRYAMQTYIVRDSDSERITLGRWTLEVVADRDVDDADPRSWAHIALDAVRATLQETATKEQQSLSVEGISLARRTPRELMDLEQRFAQIVAREESTKRRERGLGGGNRVRGYFP